MGQNDYYWNRAKELKQKARTRTIDNKNKYADEINNCISRSVIYDQTADEEFSLERAEKTTRISVTKNDSVAEIFQTCSLFQGKTAVLNFASYKNPGGGFLDGSSAQEESLCHASILYNVLAEFDDTYYAWNRNNLNRAMYLNRTIYTPDVLFFKETGGEKKIVACDVITCAAPNYSAAKKYGLVYYDQNKKVLENRIKFILNIAKENGVDNLILGAFGCGVFGQDAMDVAKIFKEQLYKSYRCFENVVFAVYTPEGSKDDNYKDFETVFASM